MGDLRGSRLKTVKLSTISALAVAGGVHALTFAPDPLPPWSLAIVQILAMTVLARSIRGLSEGWQAFARGWWFGFLSFCVGLYWLYISMHHYGGLGMSMAVAGVALLSAFLALFSGLACGLAVWLGKTVTPKAFFSQALTWAVLWAGMEWLRSVLFSGFPWLNVGYAHIDGPLAGWAPLIGVHGIALLAAFIAAGLAALPRPTKCLFRPFFPMIALAAPMLGGWALTKFEWSTADGEPLHVHLIQGNIEQSQKFDPDLIELSILQHLELARQPPVPGEPDLDLIVLPETVLPQFQSELDPRIWEAWRGVAEQQRSTIVMGVPLDTVDLDGGQRLTNSAIGFDATTPVSQLVAGTMPQRYDKRHLVPWGEYVPPGFGWFVQLLNMPLGEFDRGPPRQTPFVVDEQHLALNICYENVFAPELLPALLPMIGSDPGASILVNLSNLAWFGDTWALRQHLQIGRLRSMETARPMLTSTNTGITAMIDHHGRVVAMLPPHQKGVLAVSVQGMVGLTPYARYGDTLVILLSGGLLIALAWRRLKYRHRPI
ncbi:apolipoprotein N-acyltransferase [Achromobacter anxifer]|uniref:apolipoprotein N-acyltransferase n=1 Tax=Achromobacter anxifer TaxID=1287737 RepID=UPI0023F9210F|nr:apolipoprotein N-acyltransferase [Achromobacter anxifer]MDF8361352.1 apolipoprotein N-acyltransferase [Achromobacter anxifer]